MPDNTQLPSASGDIIATDDIGGVKYQRVKMVIGADGVNDGDVSSANPLPVSISGSMPITISSEVEIKNDSGSPVPVTGTVDTGLSQPLTNTELRATALPVALDPASLTALETISVNNFPASQAVTAASLPLPTGAATETTLAAVNTKLANPLTVNVGLTDAQLRAAPVTMKLQGATNTVDTKALGVAVVDGDVGIISNTVIHGRSTAGGGSFVDVKVNPSGALNVSIGDSALPTGAATEVTLQAIEDLQTEIRALNDTMVYLISAVLEKMPRVTGNDQAAVFIENTPTVNIAASQTLATVTTVSTLSNISQIGGQEALTAARAQIMSGATYIYDNVKVT